MPRSESESGHRLPASRLRGAVAAGALASVALVVPGAGSALASGADSGDLIVSLHASQQGAVKPGQVVTYTVTAENVGSETLKAETLVADFSGVLDDADEVDASAWSAKDANGVRTWTDDIPAGTSVTISEKVRVHDHVAPKAVLNASLRPQNFPGGPDTSNPVAGLLVATMTTSPAAGVDIKPGEDVTYTLTATNVGGEALTAEHLLADFSGVLDDADEQSASPVASTGQATDTDGTLAWTGDVAAGATVTITEKVRVHDHVDLGATLDASFRPEGWTGGPEASNPVAGLLIENLKAELGGKPLADGTQVHPGDVVTYTVTATNVGGKALADQNLFPDLSDVADDAELVRESVSMDDHISAPVLPDVVNNHFGFTGTIGAGRTESVMFQVKVKNQVAPGAVLNADLSGWPNGPHQSNPVTVVPAGTSPQSASRPVRTATAKGATHGTTRAAQKPAAKAPAAASSAVKTAGSAAGKARAALPKTGADVAGALGLAAALTAGGLMLTAVQRRRRRQGM